jgi:hypothetical protein
VKGGQAEDGETADLLVEQKGEAERGHQEEGDEDEDIDACVAQDLEKLGILEEAAEVAQAREDGDLVSGDVELVLEEAPDKNFNEGKQREGDDEEKGGRHEDIGKYSVSSHGALLNPSAGA